MRALGVLAPPQADNLSSQQAPHAIDAQRRSGDRHACRHLYAEGFQPALTETERRLHYTTPEPGPDIIALQQRLAAADTLVLVFPTWWFSMPAILKGWFDRVWAPKFAFEHGTPIKPLLNGLKACLVVTTLGSPWWIDALIMRQPVKRVLKTGLVFACAPQAKFHMLSFHEAETADAARVEGFAGRLRKAVGRL